MFVCVCVMLCVRFLRVFFYGTSFACFLVSMCGLLVSESSVQTCVLVSRAWVMLLGRASALASRDERRV